MGLLRGRPANENIVETATPGWKTGRVAGGKYVATRDLTVKEIGPLIRKDLSREFGKGWKFSTRVKYSSMMASIDVTATAAPYLLVENKPVKRDAYDNDWQFTARGNAARAKTEAIVEAYNKTNFQPYEDIHETRFYSHIDFDTLAERQWKQIAPPKGKGSKSCYCSSLPGSAMCDFCTGQRKDPAGGKRRHTMTKKGGKKRHALTGVSIRAVTNAMNKTREPWSPNPKTPPWFLNPRIIRIMDAGAAKGWLRRPSTSQVEWTEKGVTLARQYMQKRKPSKKWRRSTDNPAVGRDVLRRAYGGKKRHAKRHKHNKGAAGLIKAAEALREAFRG